MRVCLFANVPKNVLDAARNDPAVWVLAIVTESLHRVGLACPCLAVGQQSCVVALQDILYGLLCSVIVDFFLSSTLVINPIKRVGVGLVAVRVGDVFLNLLWINKLQIEVLVELNQPVVVADGHSGDELSVKGFSLHKGPNSDNHLEIL